MQRPRTRSVADAIARADSAPGHLRPAVATANLYATRQPRFVVDLRRARTDENAKWLLQRLDFRQIGSGAMDYGFTQHVVPDLFDGLIYFEQTTASKLRPR